MSLKINQRTHQTFLGHDGIHCGSPAGRSDEWSDDPTLGIFQWYDHLHEV